MACVSQTMTLVFIYLFIVVFLQGLDDDDSASVTTVSVLSYNIKQ